MTALDSTPDWSRDAPGLRGFRAAPVTRGVFRAAKGSPLTPTQRRSAAVMKIENHTIVVEFKNPQARGRRAMDSASGERPSAIVVEGVRAVGLTKRSRWHSFFLGFSRTMGITGEPIGERPAQPGTLDAVLRSAIGQIEEASRAAGGRDAGERIHR